MISLDSPMIGQQVANYSMAMAPFQDLLGQQSMLHNRSLSEPLLSHDAFMGTPPLLGEEYMPSTQGIQQVGASSRQYQEPLHTPRQYQPPPNWDARSIYPLTTQHLNIPARPHAKSQDYQFGKLYLQKPRKQRHSRARSEAYHLYTCPIVTCSKMCKSKYHVEQHTTRYHPDCKRPIQTSDTVSRKRASSQVVNESYINSQYHDPESKAATELQDIQYAIDLERLLKRHGRLPRMKGTKLDENKVEQSAEAKW